MRLPLLLMLLLALPLARADDFDDIVAAWNGMDSLPAELQSALHDERITLSVYESEQHLERQRPEETLGIVMDGVRIGKVVHSELQDSTMRVHVTRKALLSLARGEKGLREALADGTLRYETGLFKRMGIALLRLRARFSHPPRVVLLAPEEEKPPAEVEETAPRTCAGRTTGNALVREEVFARNCSTCEVELLSDSCAGLFTLVERTCVSGVLVEEGIDCSSLRRICAEGACSRNTSRSTSVQGFTEAEHILALRSQGAECFDSDLGQPEERGTVFARNCSSCAEERREDYCLSDFTLKEYSCGSSVSGKLYPTSQEVQCACAFGRCAEAPGEVLEMQREWLAQHVVCEDSDGGERYERPGEAQVRECPTCALQATADSCETSAILKEQVCDAVRRERSVNCQEVGFTHCEAGRCTSEPGAAAKVQREREQMSASVYYDVAKESGQRCVWQRTTLSAFPGDARDRVYYKQCESCNYTIYQDECYEGKVYDFLCDSAGGPVVTLALPCPAQEMCYLGACVPRGDITDFYLSTEEARQAKLNTEPLCWDSDSGQSPRTAARVELRDCPFCPPKSDEDTYPDVCRSAREVEEQFCNGDERKTRVMPCDADRRCSAGACILSSP